MSRVQIVTDSACDLPVEVLEQEGAGMVPLTVHFGDEQLKDAIEIKPIDFYPKLATSPHHPRTSQPSPADFVECYQRVAPAGESIVSIHLSARLSGTYQSAVLAKSMLPEVDVEVFDSRSASLGCGLMVLRAAAMAREGAGKEEILSELEALRGRMPMFFSVETLEYLRRNGRIGRAQHLLGTLLNMKPILTLDTEGVVEAVDRVRGRSKVVPRVLELMQEKVSAGSTINCAVMHGNVPDAAADFLEQVRQVYRVEYSSIQPLGAVIGTHVGPGTLGVAFYRV